MSQNNQWDIGPANPSEGSSSAQSASKINVLHVVKGLGPGGAERLLVHQVLARDASAFEYSVVRQLEHKDQLTRELTTADVSVSVLGTGIWPVELRKMLRHRRPDIIHVHSPLLASATRLLTRFGRVSGRVVTTEHNRWPRHHWATRLANRLTASLDDATIAVSDDVRQSMDKRVRSRAVVLRHGIPVKAVSAVVRDRDAMREELGLTDFTIGIVANFRPEKGYDIFLAAAKMTLAIRPDIQFVVVGQGPGEMDFRSEIAQLDHADRILVTGYRPDATSVMSAFDIFTLTSRHEGLPVSLMEALALGLPVVATRAGGIPEALTDGVQGQLVQIDDVEAISQAWLKLAADAEERGRMSLASIETAATFDSAVSTSEIESLYRRLITGSA